MDTLLRAKPITAGEFEKFDPEWRYDLIEGELVPMPPMPGYEHGDVTGIFTALSGSFILEKRLGKFFAAETRFTIEHDPDTAIGPDWAFIVRERLPADRPTGFAAIVPDAILEVRSPSDTEKQAEAKMKRWMDAGVRLGWELNPRKKIMTIYRPGQANREIDINGTISGEDVLPGFELPMRRLFEDV